LTFQLGGQYESFEWQPYLLSVHQLSDVETYSAGNTDVVFTQAPRHYELLIRNKYRAIQPAEVNKIRDYFLRRKVDERIIDKAAIQTIHTDRLIEMSIPIITEE
jgi:hypothetical protein